jgi:hypothetical protein
MKPYKYNEIVLFALLVVISFMLAGCLVSDSEVSYAGRKRPIGNQALRQIECGQTTRDWLVAALGEPTEKSLTEDGTEIFRYKCIETRDNEFILFPIVFVDDERETDHSVSFEIKDGIVQRFWKEG